jgi:hypothetical protein
MLRLGHRGQGLHDLHRTLHLLWPHVEVRLKEQLADAGLGIPLDILQGLGQRAPQRTPLSTPRLSFEPEGAPTDAA